MISMWLYDSRTAKRDDIETANELAEKYQLSRDEKDLFVQGFMAGLQYQQKREKKNETE